MDVQSYLHRLNLDTCEEPSSDHLKRLHERHMLRVPFENLDIHLGVPILLDEDRFLRKIVENRRGGFCYELNGAFAWLLQNLGYTVTLLAAEVARKEGGFGVAFDHMVLRVDLDEAWLADVGFGNSFRYPLRLVANEEVEQWGDRFRLVVDGDWWILERWKIDAPGFVPQYRFRLTPRRLSDYADGCRYHQTSPSSTFTRGPICSMALPDGRVTLRSEKIVTTRSGGRIEEPVRSRREWLDLLERRFGIVL